MPDYRATRFDVSPPFRDVAKSIRERHTPSPYAASARCCEMLAICYAISFFMRDIGFTFMPRHAGARLLQKIVLIEDIHTLSLRCYRCDATASRGITITPLHPTLTTSPSSHTTTTDHHRGEPCHSHHYGDTDTVLAIAAAYH